MAAHLPDKPTADRIATMVEARLLRSDHYIPWADDLVISLDTPPAWATELCTTPYRPAAVALLRRYAASPPFEGLAWSDPVDDYVACLLLRYRRGEIACATLLEEAGRKLDANGGCVPCEDVYEMLNALERAEYSKDVAEAQAARVARIFAEALARIEPLYATFAHYPERARLSRG